MSSYDSMAGSVFTMCVTLARGEHVAVVYPPTVVFLWFVCLFFYAGTYH